MSSGTASDFDELLTNLGSYLKEGVAIECGDSENDGVYPLVIGPTDEAKEKAESQYYLGIITSLLIHLTEDDTVELYNRMTGPSSRRDNATL